MGASGGNCGGVEAPNVITLEGASGERWSRSVDNSYGGPFSVGPSELGGLSGSVVSLSLSRWDPRYVPYLMSVNLDAGGLIRAACLDDGSSECGHRGTWGRAATTPSETSMTMEEFEHWRPEKFVSLRVYDVGECRVRPPLDLAAPNVSVAMAAQFIQGLERSYSFRLPHLRYMDVVPVFRGPESRFAELIITPENEAALFEDAGQTRRLRPLREIPAHHFKDGFHPMSGDYLSVRLAWDAAELKAPRQARVPPRVGPLVCTDQDDPRVAITANADVVILNWDAMIAADGAVTFNVDRRPANGVPDECNIVPNSSVIPVASGGDWINWAYDDAVAFSFYLPAGAPRQLRRLYVDTTDLQAQFSSDWVVGEGTTRDGLRRGFQASLGNGLQRELLERWYAVQLPASYGNSGFGCRSDTDCFVEGLSGGFGSEGFADAHNLICVNHGLGLDTTPGTCRRLPNVERIMLTPQGFVVVTADGTDAVDYEQLRTAGQCQPEGFAEARLGQIGNPDLTPEGNFLFRGYVAPQSSGFSRTVEEARLGTVSLPTSLPAVRPPL